MPKPKAILVVGNYGGRRLPEGQLPKNVQDWGAWDCDPEKTGPPKQKHAYGTVARPPLHVESFCEICDFEWRGPASLRPTLGPMPM